MGLAAEEATDGGGDALGVGQRVRADFAAGCGHVRGAEAHGWSAQSVGTLLSY